MSQKTIFKGQNVASSNYIIEVNVKCKRFIGKLVLNLIVVKISNTCKNGVLIVNKMLVKRTTVSLSHSLNHQKQQQTS